MKKRDELVQSLKDRLDRWNAEADLWESRFGRTRDVYRDMFRARREEALYQLTLLEKASESAFADIARGTEQAWDALASAYEAAHAHFEKSAPKSRA
jgi:hypothetical protein